MQGETILSLVFGGLWLVMLVAFVPYVARTRHPASKPLGAYLSFTTIFTLVAYAIFGGILAVHGSVWPDMPLDGWIAAVVVLIVSFVPAFVAAAWMISKRPPRAPSLEDAPPHVMPVGTEPGPKGRRRD